MYRMNITKGKIGDILVLLLFEKIKDEDFMSESEMFNNLIDVMKLKGMQPKLHEYFFDVDGNFRSKYKNFSNMLKKDRDVAINIWYDDEEESTNEEYVKIIETCVKKLTKKENPNPEKLKTFVNEVLNEVLNETEV